MEPYIEFITMIKTCIIRSHIPTVSHLLILMRVFEASTQRCFKGLEYDSND